MVKTGLIEAIDSFVPLDEHFATFQERIFKKNAKNETSRAREEKFHNQSKSRNSGCLNGHSLDVFIQQELVDPLFDTLFEQGCCSIRVHVSDDCARMLGFSWLDGKDLVKKLRIFPNIGADVRRPVRAGNANNGHRTYGRRKTYYPGGLETAMAMRLLTADTKEENKSGHADK
ncbi:hypothetical protein Tco_0872554 [Tanacetum coccineum]